MGENTKIAWTATTLPDGTVIPGYSWNPWIGCTKVSSGCLNCYAENLMDKRYGKVKWGPNNPRNKTKTWKDPLRWNRKAEGKEQRPRVFCASLADYLDEEVETSWRTELFELIDKCTNLDWLMLTKRIENAEKMLPSHWLKNPPLHVWYGTTAENQEYWNKRVPVLQGLNAKTRFVSYEPALSPITMGDATGIDWVIIGGESDQSDKARPFNLEWAKDLIDECKEKDVKPFVKQIGSNAWFGEYRYKTKDKAGADPAEWQFIEVREVPKSKYHAANHQ